LRLRNCFWVIKKGQRPHTSTSSPVFALIHVAKPWQFPTDATGQFLRFSTLSNKLERDDAPVFLGQMTVRKIYYTLLGSRQQHDAYQQ